MTGGFYHALALTPDGRVWSWGDNGFGALGTGTNTPSAVPQVSSFPPGYRIAAGAIHTLVATPAGELWVCGSNQGGQLGNGQGGVGVQSAHPIQIAGVTASARATQGRLSMPISGGYMHSLCIDGGRVLAWGDNAQGQLGDGTTNPSTTPVPAQIGGRAPAVAVAAGFDFSLALFDDGSVWSWGSNSDGQLGIGSTSGPQLTPQQIPLSGPARAVYAGGAHAAVILMDSTLWGWGYNGRGAVGNGSTGPVLQPVQMASKVHSAALGLNHGLAVISREVRTWGDNHYGEVGDGTSGNVRTSPVPTSHHFRPGGFEVGAGGNFSFAFPSR